MFVSCNEPGKQSRNYEDENESIRVMRIKRNYYNCATELVNFAKKCGFVFLWYIDIS